MITRSGRLLSTRSIRPYDRNEEIIKDQLNAKFTEFLLHRYDGDNSSDQIGIMDSLNMRTTKHLLSNGILSSNIFTIERHDYVSSIHRQNGIRSFTGNLRDFSNYVSTLCNDRFKGFYLDTCNQIRTCSGDILDIVNKAQFSRSCVIGTTFSKRSIIINDTYDDNFANFNFNILNLFSRKGYHMVNFYDRSYRQMHTAFYLFDKFN